MRGIARLAAAYKDEAVHAMRARNLGQLQRCIEVGNAQRIGVGIHVREAGHVDYNVSATAHTLGKFGIRQVARMEFVRRHNRREGLRKARLLHAPEAYEWARRMTLRGKQWNYMPPDETRRAGNEYGTHSNFHPYCR
jgi:hypothetical protein